MNPIIMETHRQNFSSCRDLAVSARTAGFQNKADRYAKIAFDSADYIIKHSQDENERRRYETFKKNLALKMSETQRQASDRRQLRASGQFLAESRTGITFDDIIGLNDAKKQIFAALYPLKYPEFAKRYNTRSEGAFIVLYGPPGTGKTSISRAITSEFDADLITVKSSDLLSPYVGESEKNIAALFRQVSSSPRYTILYFDDADTLFTRGNANETHQASILNEFKTQIEGFNGRANVMILLSCNNPSIIDEAILSRATNTIYVGLPNSEDRKAIFSKELKGILLSDNIDFGTLSELTNGFSGRDIHQICDRACKGRMLNVARAYEQGIPDVVEGVTMSDLTEEIINFNEAMTQMSDFCNKKQIC